MFTKVHHKVLEVEYALPSSEYRADSVNALGLYNETTFKPTITTFGYPNNNWGVGTGHALLNMSFSYENNSYSGIYNSSGGQSIWCNCTISAPKGGVITALHYYYASDSSSWGKKARYVDLYLIENGSYKLIQTLETKAAVNGGPSNELLPLATPLHFNGTIAPRVVARTPWNDGYLWVSEIYIKGYALA